MALNLTSRLQVTAHYFWNRRNSAALSHHGVRLDYDPEQRRMSALILGYTLTFLAIGLAALMAYIKPAGQVGKSPDPGRPRHRRDLCDGRRAAASGAEFDQRPADHR